MKVKLNNMQDFRNMLTLGRIRGFVNASDLTNFTAEELWQIWDWLDDLSIEINLIKQAVRKLREQKGK